MTAYEALQASADRQTVMTPVEFAAAMRKVFADHASDKEVAHMEADALMCAVLESLGYGAGTEVFRDADKWYA